MIPLSISELALIADLIREQAKRPYSFNVATCPVCGESVPLTLGRPQRFVEHGPVVGVVCSGSGKGER